MQWSAWYIINGNARPLRIFCPRQRNLGRNGALFWTLTSSFILPSNKDKFKQFQRVVDTKQISALSVFFLRFELPAHTCKCFAFRITAWPSFVLLDEARRIKRELEKSKNKTKLDSSLLNQGDSLSGKLEVLKVFQFLSHSHWNGAFEWCKVCLRTLHPWTPR